MHTISNKEIFLELIIDSKEKFGFNGFSIFITFSECFIEDSYNLSFASFNEYNDYITYISNNYSNNLIKKNKDLSYSKIKQFFLLK